MKRTTKRGVQEQGHKEYNKDKPSKEETMRNKTKDGDKEAYRKVKRNHSPIREEGGQVKEEVLHDAMLGGGGDIRKQEHVE